MEAEYALDETSALCLFDELLPRLAEHRKFEKRKKRKPHYDDFKAKREAHLLKIAIMNHELPVVKKENSKLKDKVQ